MALRAQQPWQYADKVGQPITSQERVKQLFDSGLDFEGCIVEAVVVEALLLHAIHLGAIRQSGGDLPKVRRRLNTLTFGPLIDRARKYVLIPPNLADDLDKYLKDRNLLVHHHLPERQDFDYQAFRDRGDHLLDALYGLVRRRMRRALRIQGDPVTAALWASPPVALGAEEASFVSVICQDQGGAWWAFTLLYWLALDKRGKRQPLNYSLLLCSPQSPP